MTTPVTYLGAKSGRPYTLATLIAGGGEGKVYTLTGLPNRCAKIYSSAIDAIRVEKLQTLISLSGVTQLTSVSAWPEEILVDASKRPVGFIMPTVTGSNPLHIYLTPSDRQRLVPDASYGLLVHIAANLCRATGNFHQKGIVLADINSSNFLVLHDGTVRIIDCDSVQIGKSKKFRAMVAMEEYVPSELQGKRVADFSRTADHDNFGLAVLVFQLLVVGRHPFSGNGATPLGKAIATRMHPFGRLHSKTCPFCVLGIDASDILSQRVKGLFAKAFDGGAMISRARPSAHEWMDALASFARELITCPANRSHAYAASAKTCPWCRLEAKGLPPIFAPTPRQRPRPQPPKKGLIRNLLGW